jgi:hypothetical protein
MLLLHDKDVHCQHRSGLRVIKQAKAHEYGHCEQMHAFHRTGHARHVFRQDHEEYKSKRSPSLQVISLVAFLKTESAGLRAIVTETSRFPDSV